ncbi:HWE histidine kinase domain-containing protein [Caulobacter sp.]|uniref:sensor histidine kinase n=1 Tax=Caulobacter sp. TaxID=78 RepID=UPI001AFFBB28|nr:HWE histidine kinase domain-containing protein [Caulobacter sp.]MBO9546251.1 PAS domain-containing protein [Caulobacter sp.]
MNSPIDFRAVFDRISTPYMLMDQQLVIVEMNQAYIEATGRPREEMQGRYVFDAFPSEGESRRLLEESFERTRDTRATDVIAVLHYAIPRSLEAGGGFEDRYWSCTHTWVPGSNGDGFVLQNTQDITDLRRLKDEAFRPEAPPTTAMLGDSVLRRVETLQSQSVQIRRLFMKAPSFVAVLRGPDHVFDFANESYLRLIGRRDIVGKPLEEALPEIREQGFIQLLDDVRRTGEPFIGRDVPVMLARQPGETLEERFLDFLYQPIIEDDGSISGVFVEGSDMTDRVVANQRQRLLMDELNHRVKNTLATVQAIAQQTLRGAADPDRFAGAFEARLLALSQTHNALTDSRWEGAGLRQILNQELGPYGDERIRMEGPDVHLPARVALSLGMVFHELATNAAKYGALSTAGRLLLSWSVSETGGLDFEWRESGGPPAAPPDRRGFGSRLIERSITGELHGTIAADYGESGLAVRFNVPLDRVFG